MLLYLFGSEARKLQPSAIAHNTKNDLINGQIINLNELVMKFNNLQTLNILISMVFENL